MVASYIEPILVVTGILTATTVALFFAPSWMVRHTFGEPLSSEGMIVMARHWGLLLFCVGMLLVYAAFNPPIRRPSVTLATVEKAAFVACVFGTPLRRNRVVSLMAAGDAVMALIYVVYLFG